MSALGHKRTFQRCRYSSFVDGFYQREFGLVQWARYAIAAIEPGLLPTINASSSFTRSKQPFAMSEAIKVTLKVSQNLHASMLPGSEWPDYREH